VEKFSSWDVLHLGHFEVWNILYMGCFVIRTFWVLGNFVAEMLCLDVWNILYLGRFIAGTIFLGTFCTCTKSWNSLSLLDNDTVVFLIPETQFLHFVDFGWLPG
jgi:hypothetical protein